MRTSYFAGIGLLLLLGCGTEATPGPGTTGTQDTSPSAKGGSTTKASSSTKSTKTGQGGSAAKTSEGEGGADSEGGAPSEGGADSTTSKTSSSKATGGTKSSSATASNATGGKSSSSGSVKTSSTGGAGGKSSGSSSSAGGKSSTAAGGTSTVATTGAGNTGGAATFKCDNLQAVAGQAGQAKPSGAAGGLKVLDWAGFKSAISYTFDDSNSSQINNYKALNDAGGHYTFYMQTGKPDASNAIWKTALQDGHELGNHTSDHSDCPSAGPLDNAQTFLKTNFGVTGYAFAAPNGAPKCKDYANKFLTDRSVNGGSMSPGDTSSLTWLPSDIATLSASGSNLAPAAGKWRTICIHGFNGGNDQAYQPIELSGFTSAVKSAVSGGSWVETVTNVAAYQVGQSLLKAGGSSIKWTKPAVFPPNMCVRATTTGGTVKQKGAEVPWNDHGYYEISLDAGEVTVE